MIGQSYSAWALVNPSPSVVTTRSKDSGAIGRGACILSRGQKPSISSGPGNTTSSVLVVDMSIPLISLRPVRLLAPGRHYPQSRLLAMAAPSARAWNLGHTTVGCTSGAYEAREEKPQSAPAMTFSLPTRLA